MEITIGAGKAMTSGIESVEVEDHDRLADKATVVVNDTFGVAADSIASGAQIKIKMGWVTEAATLFQGLIHGTPSESTAGARRLTIIAYDLSTVMHVETKPRVHLAGSLSSIIEGIVGTYKDIKIGQIAPDPNPTYVEGDPALTQPSMTDLQFIQSLAVRNRARAFVEYCKDPKGSGPEDSYFFFIPEAKIASQPSGGTLRCCGGFHEIISFRMDRVMTSAAPYRPTAVIDPVLGTPQTTQFTPDPPEPPPTLGSDREAAADAQGKGDAARASVAAAASAPVQPTDMIQQLHAAGLPSDPTLAEAMSRRDPTTIRGLRGRGVAVGNIHLRAKSMVTISGIATYGEGDWYIRIAKHKIENGSYTTELTVTR